MKYNYVCIECFHSRGQHLCKFVGTKGGVCIRKEFNSQRTVLGHRHGCRFIVLGHQYGRRDAICSASSTVNINFKLADVKLESFEAYLLKLEKNMSWGFEIIDIFCKNAVLNICLYLTRFYTYKKINNSSLKLDYSLLRMPKIIEIG